MAKILVLNGSPHKSASTTMAVTNAFVKGMCEGGEYESEIINISDLNVTPCMGCLSCWARTEGECVIKMMTCRQLRKNRRSRHYN